MSLSPLSFEKSLAALADPTCQASRWRSNARPGQLPPDGDQWNVWLILAGRGYGKTFTGAGWLIEQATTEPGEYAIFAPTARDIRVVCIEGPKSGMLDMMPPGLLRQYNRTTHELRLHNGSVIHGVTAEKPDRARGLNLSGAWCDELSSWQYPATWYEGLIPALRIGDHPRVVVTTTPRPVSLVRELLKRTDGSVAVTRGSTYDNAANLSATALTELRARYEGTRIGRQELYGELLEDVEGALWTIDHIDRLRRPVPKDLTRVVVAIDPAGGSLEHNDETGIVVAARGTDGDGYVLDDQSGRYTPNGWASRAIAAYDRWHADRIVAERNYGGDMVEATLRSAGFRGHIEVVTASRGKRQRAEPIAAFYEQGRVHHSATFPELEDQMATWLPDSGTSPDRMDALVWALTDLMEHSSAAAFLDRLAAAQKTEREPAHAEWSPQPQPRTG